MHVVRLDFKTKAERVGDADELSAQPAEGIFYWVILGPDDELEIAAVLDRLGVPAGVSAALCSGSQESRYDLHDRAIHFSVTEAWLDEEVLSASIVEFVLGSHYLVVKTSRASPVVQEMLRLYRDDFHAFARSSGFLIFELASLLFAAYRRTFHRFTGEVEKVQLALFGEVSDDIFMTVSKRTADILAFRRMALAARDLFKELSSRKSALISETTQPSLAMLADRMERLGDDLDSERTVLAETLNLYMGMVSHRTNRVLNRLTIFSMIFLPLSFLCGVYGMNFAVMPELQWAYSYPVFWGVVSVFVTGSLLILKKKKWI
jgi:magnesium transporter